MKTSILTYLGIILLLSCLQVFFKGGPDDE